MLAQRARLVNVRSRSELDVGFGSGLTVLVGPNGAGKTTVLEALVLVLQGGLLRAGNLRDLINREEKYLRAEVDLESDSGTTVAAAAYSRDGERRLTADGAALDDVSRWQESLPVRTFVPDDLRLIKGSPRRRRLYLDELAARCEPEYRVALGRYDEALAQRNTLLRMSRMGGAGTEFTPWETILAQTGLAVTSARAATLAAFVAHFQHIYSDLTGEPAESLRLVYRSNTAGMDDAQYRERLAESRQADRQRTFTNLGPHRDDLRLMRGGLDMRECASQGEQRAAVLTLVLAEWENSCLAGQKPLLLLDDVMSELDESRRRALIRIVSRGGQVIITTTDLRYFSDDEVAGATVVDLGKG